MDLPPDKAKVLNSYDDDKKWDIICDQVCVLCSLIVPYLTLRYLRGEQSVKQAAQR